jgi:hypothetical protein
MYRHTHSRLRGPVSRARAWWKSAAFASQPTHDSGRRSQDPGIRVQLVARVRREIAEGRYETPDKWEAALERLLAHLDWY